MGDTIMPYNPNRHHRRSIRLRGYDYTRPGHYFITICAQGRQRLFGAVVDSALRPNDAGRLVERWWNELGNKFPTVATDAFVVMPDHIHGIVVIGAPGDAGIDVPTMNANESNDHTTVGADVPIRPRRSGIDSNDGVDSDDAVAGGFINPPRRDDRDDTGTGDDPNAAAVSISRIVQWFKIMTTTGYIRQVKHAGWPPFDRRVWQRGYYERIVRDERELAAVRRYIAANPARHIAHLDALLRRMERKD
jgi:REP element-mobilizing transposase RayT